MLLHPFVSLGKIGPFKWALSEMLLENPAAGSL
jgi:hypothetical protein